MSVTQVKIEFTEEELRGLKPHPWTCFTCWTEVPAFETHWLESCLNAAERQIRQFVFGSLA